MSEEELAAPAALSTFEDELDLDVLQNIPVVLSAEVGRSSLKIKDLLRLSEGSVVEFDRLAGESIDVCVNNTVIAKGEVVVVLSGEGGEDPVIALKAQELQQKAAKDPLHSW